MVQFYTTNDKFGSSIRKPAKIFEMQKPYRTNLCSCCKNGIKCVATFGDSQGKIAVTAMK